MLLIDGLVIAGACGLIFIGALGIRYLRRQAKPEIQGEENAEAALNKSKRRCKFCLKDTDYRVDVFMHGSWFHYSCYLNQPEKKGN